MSPIEPKSTDEGTPRSIPDLLRAAGREASAGRFEKAVSLLNRIFESEPNNLKALDLMGFVRFFQQQYEQCEQLCRKALEVSPGHAYALSGLGMALAKQGKLEEGIEKLEAAMAATPTWPEPYWDAAVILIEAKDLVRARHILQKGITAVPASAARFHTLLSKITPSK